MRVPLRGTHSDQCCCFSVISEPVDSQSLMGETQHTRKPTSLSTVVRGKWDTAGRAREVCNDVPGPAAQRPGLLLIGNPGGTIVGRLIIIIMPVIEAPFPDIAMDVKETEWIGGKSIHRRSLLSAPLAAAVNKISLIITRFVAPPIAAGGSGPRRIFPLRLAGQAIIAAGLFAQPLAVGCGIFPGHVDYRAVVPSPSLSSGKALELSRANIS